MGAVQSKPSASEEFPSPGVANIEGAKVGFQVLFVTAGSPAERAGLVPFFDYIIAVDGIRVVYIFLFHLLRSASLQIRSPKRPRPIRTVS